MGSCGRGTGIPFSVQSPTTMGSRPTNIIAAPSSIHVSVLERYIPPTTAQEVNDFFTLSRRSYLADRLLELSSNNGTLLLVYPTRRRGSTFANRYVGPVIEPFLRQLYFSMDCIRRLRRHWVKWLQWGQ